LVALIAAVSTLVALALAIYAPRSPVTWAFIVGAVVFVAVMWFHPSGWYRRMASLSFSAAGVAAAMPALTATVDTAWVKGAVQFAPGSSVACLVAGAFFAYIDYRFRRPATARSTPFVQISHDVGVTDETLQIILRHHEQHLESKDAIIKDLEAALARAGAEARAGSSTAKEALDEARHSGDMSKLQAVLVRVAELTHSNVTEGMLEYIELCREIAAVAFLRGDIDEAQTRLNIILEADPEDLSALLQVGRIQLLRGNPGEAERSFRRILQISEAKAWKPGLSSAYIALGSLYRIKGDSVQAEQMYRQAMKIEEELGSSPGAMAAIYANLGNLYSQKGEFAKAEQMLLMSLKIEEELGRREGMAADYGNLAIVYRRWGKLAQAEEMFHRALQLNEELGRRVGMAHVYNNLGNLYQVKGDPAQAEQMHRKALQLNEELGRWGGIAYVCMSLGTLHGMKGELAEAEQMICRALAIHEELGQRVGIASCYGNLGKVYKEMGKIEMARAAFQKAKFHYELLDDGANVRLTEDFLDELKGQ
jgi:tetratricopeptide (TPR) repeat protein